MNGFGFMESKTDGSAIHNILTSYARLVTSQARTPPWRAQSVQLEEGPRRASAQACSDPGGYRPEKERHQQAWFVVAFLDKKRTTSRGASHQLIANEVVECDESLPEREGYSSSTPIHPSPYNKMCASSLRCFRIMTGSPST